MGIRRTSVSEIPAQYGMSRRAVSLFAKIETQTIKTGDTGVKSGKA